MSKLIVVAIVFLIGIAGVAPAIAVVPEIDPSAGVNSLALLVGALALFRGRRRK